MKNLFLLSMLFTVSTSVAIAKDKRKPAQANIGSFKAMGHGVENLFADQFSEVAKYVSNKQYVEGSLSPVKSLSFKENCKVPDITKADNEAIYQNVYEINYHNSESEYILATSSMGEKVNIKDLDAASVKSFCKRK